MSNSENRIKFAEEITNNFFSNGIALTEDFVALQKMLYKKHLRTKLAVNLYNEFLNQFDFEYSQGRKYVKAKVKSARNKDSKINLHSIFSPKLLVGKTIKNWVKEINPRVSDATLKNLLNILNINLNTNEIVSSKMYFKYKKELNLLYGDISHLESDNNTYEKPRENPFFNHKYKNPTKLKEGNYFKLIYIRSKS